MTPATIFSPDSRAKSTCKTQRHHQTAILLIFRFIEGSEQSARFQLYYARMSGDFLSDQLRPKRLAVNQVASLQWPFSWGIS